MPLNTQSPCQMQIYGGMQTPPRPCCDVLHVPIAGTSSAPGYHVVQGGSQPATAVQRFISCPPVSGTQAQAEQKAAAQPKSNKQSEMVSNKAAIQPVHAAQPAERPPRAEGCEKPAEKPPKANDCGCGWPTCPFCKGGQIPDLDVSCVSLGSWCGVSQCLRGLEMRTAAFPFDWNRVSMDGVIHFLETKFEDFLQYNSTKDFPWDPDHGGKAYCGDYHSFWHDDLTKPEESKKYQRRIERFFQNPSEKLLFIRACNESDDVRKAEKLLETLQTAFPGKEVWLLMIADHQTRAGSYVVEGTNGKLLVHLTDKRHLRTWMYYDDVKAYEEAVRMALRMVRDPSVGLSSKGPTGYVRSIDSLANFADCFLEPFSGGNPQCETWDPRPVQPKVTPVVGMPKAPNVDTISSAPLQQQSPTPRMIDPSGKPVVVDKMAPHSHCQNHRFMQPQFHSIASFRAPDYFLMPTLVSVGACGYPQKITPRRDGK